MPRDSTRGVRVSLHLPPRKARTNCVRKEGTDQEDQEWRKVSEKATSNDVKPYFPTTVTHVKHRSSFDAEVSDALLVVPVVR